MYASTIGLKSSPKLCMHCYRILQKSDFHLLVAVITSPPKVSDHTAPT